MATTPLEVAEGWRWSLWFMATARHMDFVYMIGHRCLGSCAGLSGFGVLLSLLIVKVQYTNGVGVCKSGHTGRKG